ncbi:MAG TPA: hypothetical protein VGB42_05405 [Candidatus Thermoplasmatota archaeon]
MNGPPLSPAPNGTRRRDPGSGRTRLAQLGMSFALAGMALLAAAGVGLLDTLPPTYGTTLAVFGAAALGAVLLLTGAVYMRVARMATDPAAATVGLSFSVDPVTGERQWIPWPRIGRVRVAGWRMGPWLRDPRFYEVEVTTEQGGATDSRFFIAYLKEPELFLGGIRERVGDRLELAPSVRR